MRKGRTAGWVFIVASVSLLTDGDGFTILATRLRTAWAFGYGIERIQCVYQERPRWIGVLIKTELSSSQRKWTRRNNFLTQSSRVSFQPPSPKRLTNFCLHHSFYSFLGLLFKLISPKLTSAISIPSASSPIEGNWLPILFFCKTAKCSMFYVQ
ncbi:hypothetical protein KQX54_018615 [Cotesia glomerata]|uniref:Secreted protein n=1 Tax=Cotesia glomerata TaxID=32391 RepID=A0AAV7IAP8_COTGL|nr:hypothetical protein KQX54_018615 [Cotesia glomerata]